MAPRYKQLDSLRGIAALVVVLGHFYDGWDGDSSHSMYTSVISPWITGPFAVIVFFVLSGFVLSLALIHKRKFTYSAYLISRVLRLYPPFAVAVIISFILWVFLSGGVSDSPSKLVRETWGFAFTWRDLINHLLMFGWPLSAFSLDRPIWSLVIELRASLLFPLLFAITRRGKWLTVAIGMFVTIIVIYLKNHQNDYSAVSANSAQGTVLMTLRYLVFFTMGIFCALNINVITGFLKGIPAYYHIGITSVFLVGIFELSQHRHWNTVLNDDFYGIVASYIICSCVASRRLTRMLTVMPFPWLGKISFSLYLIHMPILFTMIITSSKYFGLGGAIIGALPLSLAAGSLMERYVERPSHTAGKRLSQLVSQNR